MDYVAIISQFDAFLKARNIKDVFYRELYRWDRRMNELAIDYPPTDWISRAFTWVTSERGAYFWSRVSMEWRKYCEENNIIG